MAGETMGEQETLAYNELKGAIMEGLYPAGYQIVERTLSDLLKMSRTPVRSALKRLEAEGFLERGTNHRIYVALPSDQELLDTLYLRAALEGMASRLAARNGSGEDFEKLYQLIAQMEKSAKMGDELAVYHLSSQMHLKVIASCGNEQLIRITTNIYEKSTIYNYQILRGTRRSGISVNEHKRIVDRIVARDEDGAEQAAREHIQNIIDEHVKRAGEHKDQDKKRLSVPWKA